MSTALASAVLTIAQAIPGLRAQHASVHDMLQGGKVLPWKSKRLPEPIVQALAHALTDSGVEVPSAEEADTGILLAFFALGEVAGLYKSLIVGEDYAPLPTAPVEGAAWCVALGDGRYVAVRSHGKGWQEARQKDGGIVWQRCEPAQAADIASYLRTCVRKSMDDVRNAMEPATVVQADA